MSDPRPVLVGVDGSSTARAAVRWAAHEAARRSCPLRVVHAVGWKPGDDRGPTRDGPAVDRRHYDDLARDAQGIVDAEVAEATDVVGAAVPTSGEVLSRFAVPRLIAESASAQVLVIGTEGLGAVAALLLGSVARSVVPRSACPVVAVRQDHTGNEHGHVVVGVDHPSTSDAALCFAVEAARSRGVGLVVVHAWHDTAFGAERILAEYAPTVVAAQRRWLADQVQLWRDKHPDLVIHEIVRMHQPAATLLDAAVGAALLVVGSRRRKQLRGLVLGSVGLALLHHATCPVAVVPPDRDGAFPVGDELEELDGDPHR
jgi:nucleotide-binding universal stress UspA family protein